MPLPVSRLRHRLQFAGAIFVTVASVYGLSRLVKPRAVPPPPPPPPITYVPAPAPEVPAVHVPPAPVLPASSLSAAFVAAIREGDLKALDKIDTRYEPMGIALRTAAGTGKTDVVDWVLEHGADVHFAEMENDAPILEADDYPAVVKLLLEKGASEPDLSVAAIAGKPRAVIRLLAKKVPVNPGDGTTPLFDALGSTMATPENKKLIVEKLLAAGADPNAGEGARSPLNAAVSSCESTDDDAKGKPMACIGLIKVLAAKGARVDGETLASALDQADADRGPLLDALLAARLEPGATAVALTRASGERDALLVKKIASRGVSWAFHDGENEPIAPLVDAVDRLDVPLVRALLDAGAPADLHLKDGRCALGQAIDEVTTNAPEAARVVELLLSHGAGVNRRLPDGRTPLFAAAETGDVRVINALLDGGARVNEHILDETALDAAERSGHTTAARVLHARGGRRAPPPAEPTSASSTVSGLLNGGLR